MQQAYDAVQRHLCAVQQGVAALKHLLHAGQHAALLCNNLLQLAGSGAVHDLFHQLQDGVQHACRPAPDRQAAESAQLWHLELFLMLSGDNVTAGHNSAEA